MKPLPAVNESLRAILVRIPEYEALRGSTGLIDRADRGVVRLEGADRRSFLQGVLTNDILALERGTACYAALLTPQGRMIADMHVLAQDEFVLLDVQRSQAAPLVSRFDMSIFTEDVTVRDVSADYGRFALAGPGAAKAMERVRAEMPRTLHFSDQAWDVPFIEVLTPADGLERAREAARGAGAIDVGSDAVNALRVESGVPLFGADMDEATIPLEAGIESRAISFTKGCYVGQEVIIRVLHRGHGRVAKRLVKLAIDAPAEGALPEPGTALTKDGREAGKLTSVAWSPHRNAAVALGYVQRDFLEPGTRFDVVAASGAVTAEITDHTEKS
jgi:folate-binding protein YgfZ